VKENLSEHFFANAEEKGEFDRVNRWGEISPIGQGCQIFRGATYQNGGKYIQKLEKIYQMEIKCTKLAEN
jgi:hypothetical protein